VKVLDSKLVAGTDSEVTVYEKALDLTKDGNDLAGGNVGSDPQRRNSVGFAGRCGHRWRVH
jgi:hypothetical protein